MMLRRCRRMPSAASRRDVLQSATAVGFSAVSRFWTVEFPLAGPVLLANLRVVSVSTVSLLSVGALIGVDGLGYLFTDGYHRSSRRDRRSASSRRLLIALVFDVAPGARRPLAHAVDADRECDPTPLAAIGRRPAGEAA